MSGIRALRDRLRKVRGIMADNLRKVMHRGEQIDEMDERASVLKDASDDFRKVAAGKSKNEKWSYYRCLIISIIIILLIIAIIVIAIIIGVVVSKNNHS